MEREDDLGRAAGRARLFWRGNVVAYTPFFAIPAADLIAGGHGPVATVVGAAAFVLFVVLYLRRAWAGITPIGHHEPWPTLLVCSGLGILTTLVLGGAWGGLLTFVAYLAGGTIRRLAVTVGVVAALAAIVATLAVVVGEVPVNGAAAAGWWAVYVIVVGGFGAGIARLQLFCEELDRARADVARLAVADERLRFARDLHDLLGHSLSVIALKSELAGRLATVDPERTATELRDIESVTREALAEVRAAVTGYRTEGGLDAELARARVALAAAGVDIRVEASDGELAADVDELFAWTVREATTNVVRHAAAAHCTIRVLRDDDADRVEVVDDGVGASARAGPGEGLEGLAERAVSAHGRIETSDPPGGGFRVAVEVPR